MRCLLPSLVVSLFLAACATVPATMDQAVFDTEMQRQLANPSAASADADLSALIARPDLSEDQRVDALFLRAEKRWDGKYNLPGAIADLDQALALRPEDSRAGDAQRRKVFAATEIENAQRRLARLQNLPDWFDDKVLMGDIGAAADRYRESGITPTDGQLYVLRESGYVCAGDGEADTEAVHQIGPEPDYVAGAVWCSDPSLS